MRQPGLLRAALAAGVATVSLAAIQTPAGFVTATLDEVRWAEQAVERLNQSREEAAVPPLHADAQLARLAYQHAHEMAVRMRVTHYSYFWGVNTASRVKLAFPSIQQFAENVAANGDVGRLHAALQASPGHRRNRVDATFTHIGVGVAAGADGRLYLAEVFVRAVQPEQLHLVELYTEMPRDRLPGDPPETGEIAAESITVLPRSVEDPEYWTNRGIDAYASGRYGEAVDHFRSALRIDPDYRYARFDLGRALLSTGEAAEARDILHDYLAVDPDDIDARASLASAQMLTGEYAAAEQSLRTVLQARLRDAGSWYNLGLALELQQQTEQAVRAYEQAVHLDPSLQAAVIALARVRR